MTVIMGRLVDADQFARVAMQADFAALRISRREVDAGLVGDVVDRLLVFTDNREVVQQYENGMTFYFDGYDQDPRELHQIPEVVAFFRQVDAQWPHWFHFVEKAGPTMGVLMKLLCEVEVGATEGGALGWAFADPRQLGRVMTRLFVGMNTLYEQYDFGERRIKSMTDQVLAAINRVLSPA